MPRKRGELGGRKGDDGRAARQEGRRLVDIGAQRQVRGLLGPNPLLLERGCAAVALECGIGDRCADDALASLLLSTLSQRMAISLALGNRSVYADGNRSVSK